MSRFSGRWNTSQLIRNLTIAAVLYFLITVVILQHEGYPSSLNPRSYFDRFIQSKTTDVDSTSNQIDTDTIYNFHRFCGLSQTPSWNSIVVPGDYPYELDAYRQISSSAYCNNSNVVQHTSSASSSSNSLHVIVIIDPVHWMHAFAADEHQSNNTEVINAWNAYYNLNDIANRFQDLPYIIVKYGDINLNQHSAIQRICECGEQHNDADIIPNMVDQTENSNTCSILQSVLFLVFRSSIQDDNVDGREVVLKTWAAPYTQQQCPLNIKFINTKSQKYTNDSQNQLFPNVVQPPFEAESGMSLLYAIEQLVDGIEWVFKLDDVTYVVVENLLQYIASFAPYKDTTALWLGNRLQTSAKDIKSIFTSGGAGYLFNRRVFEAIVNEIRSYPDSSQRKRRTSMSDPNAAYALCGYRNWEDLCVSGLMHAWLDVRPVDTLDSSGFEKFNVWSPMTLFGYGGIYKLPIDWYSKYKGYLGQPEDKVGFEYISATPISFHYVKPDWMQAYFSLFVDGVDAANISTISQRIGKHHDRELRLRHLDEYAGILKQNIGQISIDRELKSMKLEQTLPRKHKLAMNADFQQMQQRGYVNPHLGENENELTFIRNQLDPDIRALFDYQF